MIWRLASRMIPMLITHKRAVNRRLSKKAKKLAMAVRKIGIAKSWLYCWRTFSSVQSFSWWINRLTTKLPSRNEKKKSVVATRIEIIEKRFNEANCSGK